MGNFKSFWVFGFERWGKLKPDNVTINGKTRFIPLCFGLWIRCRGVE